MASRMKIETLYLLFVDDVSGQAGETQAFHFATAGGGWNTDAICENNTRNMRIALLMRGSLADYLMRHDFIVSRRAMIACDIWWNEMASASALMIIKYHEQKEAFNDVKHIEKHPI